MGDYSGKAQPFLDAIATSFFASADVRNWLIAGTPVETAYTDASVLFDEQRATRWKTKQTKQPFWANYFCGLDSRCTCRIEGSKSLESDAIFFLRNSDGRVLAIHVEFKHRKKAFGFGQPEGYPLRAQCFSRKAPKTVNQHNDWTTVIFCDAGSASDPRLSNFHRVITHDEAAKRISGYPSLS